jgi:hypothetical protein
VRLSFSARFLYWSERSNAKYSGRVSIKFGAKGCTISCQENYILCLYLLQCVWCSRERLPAAAAQPANVRQSCSATDNNNNYYYYYLLQYYYCFIKLKSNFVFFFLKKFIIQKLQAYTTRNIFDIYNFYLKLSVNILATELVTAKTRNVFRQ